MEGVAATAVSAGRNTAKFRNSNPGVENLASLASLASFYPEGPCPAVEEIFVDRPTLDVEQLGLRARGKFDMGEVARAGRTCRGVNKDGSDAFPEGNLVNTIRRQGDLAADVELREIPVTTMSNRAAVLNESTVADQFRPGKPDATSLRFKE